MAKESVKARQRKRQRMVAQYAERRAALKAAGDWQGLDQLPRNSSKVRLKNRCQLTGDMALAGKIPGVRKASW
jgi:small subunit ribosomal protein S14